MNIFLLALVIALLSSPASAQPLPFEGRWAQQAAWCDPAARPADGLPPIVLTRRKLDAGMMTCDFTSVKPGDTSYRVEANCVVAATKERGRELFGFSRVEDVLHWTWGDRTLTFQRCPK